MLFLNFLQGNFDLAVFLLFLENVLDFNISLLDGLLLGVIVQADEKFLYD